MQLTVYRNLNPFSHASKQEANDAKTIPQMGLYLLSVQRRKLTSNS